MHLDHQILHLNFQNLGFVDWKPLPEFSPANIPGHTGH